MTLEEFETELQKKINDSIESELDINEYEIVYLSFQPEDYDYEHYADNPPSGRIQTTKAESFEINHKTRQIILR